MVKKAAAEVKIGVDAKSAKSDLKDLERSFKRSATNINASLELAGKAFSLVSGALKGVLGMTKEFVELASVQEKAERRLQIAMAGRKGATAEFTKELNKFNGVVQQQTAIGDEQLLQLQGTLSLMGVMPGKLKEATKATIGLTQITGQGFNEAAKVTAKVMKGNVTALNEYGIKAASTADAMGQLRASFEVAKDATQTLSGQVERLGGNFGDFKEALGAGVTQSDTAFRAFDTLNDALVDLIGLFDSEEGRGAIDDFFKGVAKGFSLFLVSVSGFIDAIDLAGDAWHRFKQLTSFTGDVGPRKGPGAFISKLKGQIDALAESLNALGDGRSATTGKLLGKRDRTALGATAGGDVGGGAFGGLKAKVKSRSIAAKSIKHNQKAGFKVTGEIEGPEGDAIKRIQATKEQLESLVADMGKSVSDGFTNMFVGIGEAIASGANVLKSMSGFIGGIIKQMGVMLIQAGTVALLANLVATVVPALQPLFGAPGVGAAAAGGAIAGGVAMVALGSAMGGGSRATGTARVSPTGGVGASGGGFSSAALPQRAGPTTRTVNVSFGRGFVVGSEQRLAGEIGRIIEAGS